MRYNRTKYDTVEQLPAAALPVSAFARQENTSASYVHIKYGRHKFGYLSKSGDRLYTDHPGYDIVDYHGACYVINYAQS